MSIHVDDVSPIEPKTKGFAIIKDLGEPVEFGTGSCLYLIKPFRLEDTNRSLINTTIVLIYLSARPRYT